MNWSVWMEGMWSWMNPDPSVVLLSMRASHCKKQIHKIYGKYRQLWLLEFYRKKYGNYILGFTVLT